MSLLDSLAGAGKVTRALSTVTDFGVSVEKHVSKTDGVTRFGLKIFPILSDGTPGRFGDMWVRLDTPDAVRALAGALPRIAASIAALDAKMVEAKEWAPAPAAAKAAPKAAKAAPAAPAAPAPSTVLDGLDLPF